MVTGRDMAQDRRQEWHQTRGLAISIILLLITNIISSIWWAASLTKDVEQLRSLPDLSERVIRLEAVSEAQTLYLTRLGSTLDKINTNMDRIDREQARRTSIVKRAGEHLGIKKHLE